MARRKLPPESFGFYVALGAGRSFAEVARHYGVAERTVSRLSQQQNWTERLQELARGVQAEMDEKAASAIQEMQLRHIDRMADLQAAVREVMTPKRLKAIFASLFKAAVERQDIGAARILIERALGRTRNESLPAMAIDLPNGLETTADVRKAANALLVNLARGTMSPEDAQKAAAVIEAARKSVETEDLDRRLREIEEEIKKQKGRR